MTGIINPFRFGSTVIDPYFANVKLLCGFDSSIVDESGSPHTLTAVGNAARDITTKKFGAASIVMDGSGDRITAANSTDWAFGSGDFTVEMFVNLRTKATNQAFIGMWNNSGVTADDAWFLWLNGSTLTFSIDNTSASIVAFTSSWTPTLGQWYFLAAARIGTTFNMYVDAARVATGTAVDIHVSISKLVLGAIGDSGSFSTDDFNGYMDEVRITKGVGRYSGATITVPTAAFPRS